MYVYCCYFVETIGDGYQDFKLLEQLGVYTTPNGAYYALLAWAKRLWGRNYVISEDKEHDRIFVTGREYCVGFLEVHDK